VSRVGHFLNGLPVRPLLEDSESELERSWDALHGENAREWEKARETVKDAWQRARERRR